MTNLDTKTISLNNLGIKDATVRYQLTSEELHNITIEKEQGVETSFGALAVKTGEFTGRSPMDRFIVKDDITKDEIWWGDINIPFDSEKPMITSGIRLGTQAATTRGFGLKEFVKVGELITKVVKGLSENPDDNSKIEEEVRNEVIELTSSFPIYKNLRK